MELVKFVSFVDRREEKLSNWWCCLLLDPDKVNELDAIGRTTAMYAANGGSSEYLEMLQFLISKEVDLQHQSNGKNLPIYLIPGEFDKTHAIWRATAP